MDGVRACRLVRRVCTVRVQAPETEFNDVKKRFLFLDLARRHARDRVPLCSADESDKVEKGASSRVEQARVSPSDWRFLRWVG